MFTLLTDAEQQAVADVWPKSGLADPWGSPYPKVELGADYVESQTGLWVPPAPPEPCWHVFPAGLEVKWDFEWDFGFSKSYRPVVDELSDLFPNLHGEQMRCPKSKCRGKYKADLASMIQHLNDYHKWTRERIADWLDSLDVDLSLQPVGEGH